MINIPTYLIQQAQRRLASIRANSAEDLEAIEDAEQKVMRHRIRIVEAELEAAELTAFLAQIGVAVDDSTVDTRPTLQEVR